MTTSLTLVGPIFGVEPEELAEIAVDHEVFRLFLGMLSPQLSLMEKRE